MESVACSGWSVGPSRPGVRGTGGRAKRTSQLIRWQGDFDDFQEWLYNETGFWLHYIRHELASAEFRQELARAEFIWTIRAFKSLCVHWEKRDPEKAHIQKLDYHPATTLNGKSTTNGGSNGTLIYKWWIFENATFFHSRRVTIFNPLNPCGLAVIQDGVHK